jgi:methylated-DNA-protein-cysteine methyltransferase related protein
MGDLCRRKVREDSASEDGLTTVATGIQIEERNAKLTDQPHAGQRTAYNWATMPTSHRSTSRTPRPARGATSYQRIYTVVRKIPRGRVASYGQVARLAGLDRQARQVGYAMHALPQGTAVPWHRVVSAAGEISRRARGAGELEQRGLLEREGVEFSWRGRIDLDRFGWKR